MYWPRLGEGDPDAGESWLVRRRNGGEVGVCLVNATACAWSSEPFLEQVFNSKAPTKLRLAST